ncbi:MAG: UDP-N-acetylmuramoyl-L-alanine--D-glutamate ligase [Candidatus Rokubacteria bacterium]|nr:UDP-N-acetylmuramoyl-L-alanine--D-glutamate ligase [Candidatus Rokubacteria bacterium]
MRGRTVSVVGLARSGVAACRLLRQLGAVVLASDAKPRSALSREALALEAEGVRLSAGGHPADAFRGAELVVVSPGVPADLLALQELRRAGVPLIGELELAWRVMEAQVIAITGTNGKTTTTALTGALLREQSRPVLVAGNIGMPLSAHALTFPPDGIVVAEVSSFQLETTEFFHPRVAAVLNLTPDHLDRHGTVERYVEAKARIFANQTEADCAVLNADDAPTAALADRTRGSVVWFSRLKPLDHGVFCRGGWIVTKLNGPLRRAIRLFRGVEHRIEWVRDLQGVAYYNDSKGTNAASTIKALESFSEPVILIAGGRGKGQDFAPLAAAARGRVRRAILIGEDREKILRCFGDAIPSTFAPSMEEAVRMARAAARPGDVVLLSPACASFDMFEDFEHRGAVFKAAVLAFGDADTR